MPSCLGLYIENNLIKYAKVSKEKENKKIEAFGVKFYERIEDGIKQVIEETYSYKIPICINVSEENYNYFNMFALLKKTDLDKAIKTEFESYCTDKGFNVNVFEGRYAVTKKLTENQQLKVIYISNNKIDLNKRMQLLEQYNLTGVYPLPIAITNLVETAPKENAVIVNIEEKTTITTIINQQIYDVKKLDEGSEDFLSKINLKENSYSKAYDVCKETTIYTSEGKELTEIRTGYLEEIMPTLYSIAGQVQKAINENMEKIQNVYITGTAALINNIDLYFQEYLEGATCEVLKPNFVSKTPDINIKDYIEVISAIAIALMGLGEGIEGMNFKKNTLKDQLKAIFTIEIGNKKTEKNGKTKAKSNINLQKIFKNDLKQPLDNIEKNLLNTAVGLLILFIVYSGFSLALKKEFVKKTEEVAQSIQNTNKQIENVKKDSSNIKQQKDIYSDYIEELEKTVKIAQEKNKTKGAYPNLLNQLMNVIPTSVQIKSIEDKGEGKIEILVQSPKYEQIAFFIGSIKTEVILTNVISTSGQKSSDIITVKIEGELP